MTKLEDMRVGDWVRWDSRDWEVTDRDVYRGSADYGETQWELSPGYGSPYYLVRSLENKDGGTEEIWICTKETGIGGVQYLSPSGDWINFKEQDSLQTPPGRARYGEVELSLDGETKGRAEDDEGSTVTKLTWDYFDSTRRRNIAIEVWKESDADYYEAYDGRVVSRSEFQPIPPRAGASRNYGSLGDAVGYLVAAAFAACFILPLAGGILTACDVGAEYLLALLLPVICIYLSYLMGVHRALLSAALAASLGAALLLIKFRGLGGSYWEYALYGVLAGPAITETAARLFGGIRPSDKSASAGNATLLLLFMISFAHYIEFAPRPHNPSGLLAACVLPGLPALLVFIVYAFKGGSDEPA